MQHACSDDEWHLINTCPAFAYVHVRLAQPQYNFGHVAIHKAAFIKQRDQIGVLRHVLDCLREVTEMSNLDRSRNVDLGMNQSADLYD